MLLSHRKKFIYIKTIKTAGTSVELYFQKYCVPEERIIDLKEFGQEEIISEDGIIAARLRIFDESKNKKFWSHMSSKNVKNKIDKETWDSYFKFCTVRNPYDLVISKFFWRMYSNAHDSDFFKDNETEQFIADPNRKATWSKHGIKEPLMIRDPNMSLEHIKDMFEKYVLVECTHIPLAFIGDRFPLDSYIRYEHLKEDLELVCKKLDIPWNPKDLGYYKSGIRPKHITPSLIYTDKAKRQVREMFELEFKHFGYQFPK